MLFRVDQVTEVSKDGRPYLQVIALPAEPSEQNMYARASMFVPIGTNVQRDDIFEWAIVPRTGF